jgi:hypothetical protein
MPDIMEGEGAIVQVEAAPIPEAPGARLHFAGLPVESVPAVATRLQQLGKADLLKYNMLPFTCRGVPERTIAALRDRAVHVAFGKRGLWQCLRCPWSSSAPGLHRLIEHSLGEIKQTAWKQSYGEDIPSQVQELIAEYRRKGSRVSVCTDLLKKEEVLEMAAAGDVAALRWARFNLWISSFTCSSDLRAQLADAKAAAPVPLPAAPLDVAAAQQQHVIAGLCAAMSFRGLSSPEWSSFLQHISASMYEPPSRWKVSAIVKAGRISVCSIRTCACARGEQLFLVAGKCCGRIWTRRSGTGWNRCSLNAVRGASHMMEQHHRMGISCSMCWRRMLMENRFIWTWSMLAGTKRTHRCSWSCSRSRC